MVTISLCMIVRNEENTLSRCLDSVKGLVDEIIIVDTGSTDRTKEIALQYTDKIFDFKWIDDFSAARNYSFSKATKDFIFWLDADDIILRKDAETFKRIKLSLTLDFDVVMMKYILQTDEKGNEIYSFYRERLVKRADNFQWHDPIHEYLNLSGKILHTEIAVTHTKTEDSSERNLSILKKVISASNSIPPRLIFYYARESEAAGNIEEAVKYYEMLMNMEVEGLCPQVEGCLRLANIYMEKNEQKKALKVLIKSFEYCPMRAETLCFIGKYYVNKKDYAEAVPWYELALSLEKPKLTWLFIMQEYWDFIPCMDLCHCYYYLGNLKKSLEYQKKAAQLKPYHPAVAQNLQFFQSLINQTGELEQKN